MLFVVSILGPLSILPSLVSLTLKDRYQIWYNPVTLGVPSWLLSFSLLSISYLRLS